MRPIHPLDIPSSEEVLLRKSFSDSAREAAAAARKGKGTHVADQLFPKQAAPDEETKTKEKAPARVPGTSKHPIRNLDRGELETKAKAEHEELSGHRQAMSSATYPSPEWDDARAKHDSMAYGQGAMPHSEELRRRKGKEDQEAEWAKTGSTPESRKAEKEAKSKANEEYKAKRNAPYPWEDPAKSSGENQASHKAELSKITDEANEIGKRIDAANAKKNPGQYHDKDNASSSAYYGGFMQAAKKRGLHEGQARRLFQEEHDHPFSG